MNERRKAFQSVCIYKEMEIHQLLNFYLRIRKDKNEFEDDNRDGNKYVTKEEFEVHKRKLQSRLNAINDVIDTHLEILLRAQKYSPDRIQ